MVKLHNSLLIIKLTNYLCSSICVWIIYTWIHLLVMCDNYSFTTYQSFIVTVAEFEYLCTSVFCSGFPPIFKEKIHDKAYNVGDSCTLKVHAIGNPMPIVSWFRNEELLNEGGRVRIIRCDDGRHSLTVLQTKPNDFGVYKCVARNKFGTVTCRARMLCGGM